MAWTLKLYRSLAHWAVNICFFQQEILLLWLNYLGFSIFLRYFRTLFKCFFTLRSNKLCTVWFCCLYIIVLNVMLSYVFFLPIGEHFFRRTPFMIVSSNCRNGWRGIKYRRTIWKVTNRLTFRLQWCLRGWEGPFSSEPTLRSSSTLNWSEGCSKGIICRGRRSDKLNPCNLHRSCSPETSPPLRARSGGYGSGAESLNHEKKYLNFDLTHFYFKTNCKRNKVFGSNYEFFHPYISISLQAEFVELSYVKLWNLLNY